MRVFTSAREALAFSINFDERQRVRGSLASSSRGGKPDEVAAVNVRVCLARAGVERGSDLERRMIEWATTPSRVSSAADAEAQEAIDDEDAQRKRDRKGWGAWRRALAKFTRELDQAGLLELPEPQPAPGYRAHQLDDTVLITVLPKPDPTDPTIFRSRAEAEQAATANVYETMPSTIRQATLAKAREMHAAGARFQDIDGLLVDKLGVADSTAREIRRRELGICGERGRPRKTASPQPQAIACGSPCARK